MALAERPRLEAALAPADERVLMVAIKRILEFARSFGITLENREGLISVYQARLADLPADLLLRAVDQIEATYRWGMRPPLPAEIREHVADALARRKIAKIRVDMIERQAGREALAAPKGQIVPVLEVKAAIAKTVAARKPEPVAEDIRPPSPSELAEMMRQCGVTAEEVLAARSPVVVTSR